MHQYMETEASYNPYIQAGSTLLLPSQRQNLSVLILDKVVLMIGVPWMLTTLFAETAYDA